MCSTWQIGNFNDVLSEVDRMLCPEQCRVSLKLEVYKTNQPRYFQLGPPIVKKMQTKLKIGETLEKVCENAIILNHKRNYKKWLREQQLKGKLLLEVIWHVY